MLRHILAFTLAVGAVAATASSQRSADQAGPTERVRIETMFVRGYFPGRSGQLMVVPREGYILTRNDPTIPFLHGSPWSYDTTIPLFFVGPSIRPGVYPTPATQQDIAPTIAAILGTAMPPTATGRVLPIVVANTSRPRVVMLVVLDGMRLDYFTTYASEMPTLSGLRKQSAWMSNVRVNYLPTNTAVGHSTIATGADPRTHGITGNNLYDRVNQRRRDVMAGVTPGELMALTLADVWQLENYGRPVVIAMGTSVPAATALAGHGSCQLNGSPTTVAAYDERTGRWITNTTCFLPIDAVNDMTSQSVYPPEGQWMGQKVDAPAEIRRTALWPAFEADTLARLIDASELGRDALTDLVLLNLKASDYVAHKYGPASAQVRTAMREIDSSVAKMIAAVKARAGDDILLVFTADHGMPGEPPPGGRIFSTQIIDALHARFDPEQKQLIAYYEPENAQLFVHMDRLAALKLALSDLARFLETQPYIFAAFTEDDIRRASRALR